MNKCALIVDGEYKPVSSVQIQKFIYELLKKAPLYKKEIVKAVKKIYMDDIKKHPQNESNLSRFIDSRIKVLLLNGKIELTDVAVGEAIPVRKYKIIS